MGTPPHGHPQAVRGALCPRRSLETKLPAPGAPEPTRCRCPRRQNPAAPGGRSQAGSVLAAAKVWFKREREHRGLEAQVSLGKPCKCPGSSKDKRHALPQRAPCSYAETSRLCTYCNLISLQLFELFSKRWKFSPRNSKFEKSLPTL